MGSPSLLQQRFVGLSLTTSLPGQPWKKAESDMGSVRYDCWRLSLSPVGGSLVIFTPFCSTLTGNYTNQINSAMDTIIVSYLV